MKKFASVLLAVLVAFSMFSFVVSAAAPKLTVSADKTNVKVGDVVTVTVKLAEKSGLGALTFDVTYDATAFKAVEMASGDLGAVVNANFAAGKARATLATATTVENAGTVCTVKLEAIKAADSTVAIAIVEACDGNFETVTVSTNSVAIKGAEAPTEKPTEQPTEKPTEKPTEQPTEQPTEKPTEKPSEDKEPCADGHTWSTWATEKVATCKEAGVKARNCTVCGEKETEAIAATGKCAYEWVVTKQATATEYGEKVLKCTMCGHVKETQKLALKQDTITNPAIPNTDAIA